MRRLAEPQVLKSALIAAVASAALCCPSFALWPARNRPIWYLESVVFLGAIVLWAFVFAWHKHYTHRPVFKSGWRPKLFTAATVGGILIALGAHWLLDPALRQQTPEDYPATVEQWIAMTLFSLAFGQLFMLFAPFAWLMRLFKSESAAFALTILFGVLVLVLKTNSLPKPFPFSLFATLLVLRLVSGAVAIWFYLRGGVLLVSWMALLVEARHLPGLMVH